MVRPRVRLRGMALLLAGAVAVHELRYTLAPVVGPQGPGERHGYLVALVPIVCLVTSALLGSVLAVLAGRRPGLVGARRALGRGPGPTLTVTWLAATVALVVLFAAQETAESLVAGGPGALPATLASGGGVLFPVAVAVGGLIALGLGVPEGPLAVAPVVGWPGLTRHRSLAVPLRSTDVVAFRRAALAWHLAGRAPPGFVA